MTRKEPTKNPPAALDGVGENDTRFRAYFHLDLIGMAVTSPVKGWTEVNDKLCDILGYPRHELVKKTWAELTYPDDLPADVEQFNRVLAGEIEGYSMEKRFVRKDGKVIDASIDVRCLRNEDNSVDQFVALIQDISNRKQAEQALHKAHDDLERRVEERTATLRSEKELLKQVFIEQERERKLIAFEIHDGIVQYATGALMLMEACISDCNHEDGPPSNMKTAAEQIRKIIEEGRRMMNGLRPLILDEEGLIAAIEHLTVEQDSEAMQITLEVKRDFERIDPRLESCIYRVVQEAVTNAKRHSQTEKILVTLAHSADHIHVEIRDWGIGFDHDHGKRGPHGLFGMTERVQLLGGNLVIESAPGEGTSIKVDLPLLVG